MELKDYSPATASDDGDRLHTLEIARQYAHLVDALRNAQVAFDTPSGGLRDQIPELKGVETAAIERHMRGIIAMHVKHGHRTAVVFDERRRIVLNVEIPAGQELGRALSKVKQGLGKAGVWSSGDESVVLQVYLLPEGIYTENPLVTRLRGVPLGLVRISVDGKSSSEMGLEPEFEIAYRPQDEAHFGEWIDVCDADFWPIRQVLRTLDRLTAELLWISGYGMITTYDVDAAMVVEPLEVFVPVGPERERLAAERTWVRIFTLSAVLYDRAEKPSLLSEHEHNSARRCKTIDPTRHLYLPVWLRENWNDYADSMIGWTDKAYQKALEDAAPSYSLAKREDGKLRLITNVPNGS